MKHILLLVGAILLTNVLSAQHATNHTPLQRTHRQILTSLLQPVQGNQAAMKTTSLTTLERIVAQSTRDNVKNTLTDSVKLGYGLSRTSTYDYNDMIYAYNYPYATSPLFSNSMGIVAKPKVLYDTCTHWEVDPNTLIYGYYETGYVSYDGNNNIISYKHLYLDSPFFPNMIYDNKFNTAKNIDNAYGYNFISGVKDSAFKQFFSYNTANQVTKDSTYEYHLGQWRLASKTFYSYDVSNNLVQIDNYANDTDTSFTQPLYEQIKYVNTYDASHRLLTVYSSFFDGTTLSPYIEDTFAYTGAYTFHSSWRETQYDPINKYWAPMFNMTKTINTLGEPDTVTIQGFDSLLNTWVPQTLDVIHYNSFKDPDTLKDYEYNFTAFPATPSFTTIYYYATFLDRSEVKNVPVAADNTIIFPNPASGSITIAQLNVPPSTRISVTLVNAAGQMVSKTSIPWHDQVQISMATLVPGAYWVMIQDEAGNMLHRQSVVKQ